MSTLDNKIGNKEAMPFRFGNYRSGAFGIVYREGQEAPHVSDDVVAIGVICLPAITVGGRRLLDPRIAFGDRFKICGVPMHANRFDGLYYTPKGEENDKNNPNKYLCLCFEFVGQVWEAIYNEAVDYITAELDGLEHMVVVRKTALTDAEKKMPERTKKPISPYRPLVSRAGN